MVLIENVYDLLPISGLYFTKSSILPRLLCFSRLAWLLAHKCDVQTEEV